MSSNEPEADYEAIPRPTAEPLPPLPPMRDRFPDVSADGYGYAPDESGAAEDSPGDGDYAIDPRDYNQTGLPDEDVPGAQAERDRLMPQACGECGAEVDFDGAPAEVDQRAARRPVPPPWPPLGDDDSEAAADAASQIAGFQASLPVYGKTDVIGGLVTEALARAVIALTTAPDQGPGNIAEDPPPVHRPQSPWPPTSRRAAQAVHDRDALDQIAALLRGDTDLHLSEGEDPNQVLIDVIYDTVGQTGRITVAGPGDKPSDRSEDPFRYLAHFTPQAWVNDSSVDVDLEPGQVREWDCTAYATEAYEGRNDVYGQHRLEYLDWLDHMAAPDGDLDSAYGVTDNDDKFRSDPAAPQWIRDWTGPFTIRIRRITVP